jgi:hypothetical protein
MTDKQTAAKTDRFISLVFFQYWVDWLSSGWGSRSADLTRLLKMGFTTGAFGGSPAWFFMESLAGIHRNRDHWIRRLLRVFENSEKCLIDCQIPSRKSCARCLVAVDCDSVDCKLLMKQRAAQRLFDEFLSMDELISVNMNIIYFMLLGIAKAHDPEAFAEYFDKTIVKAASISLFGHRWANITKVLDQRSIKMSSIQTWARISMK